MLGTESRGWHKPGKYCSPRPKEYKFSLSLCLGKDSRQLTSLKLNCRIQLKVGIICAFKSNGVSSIAQNIDVCLQVEPRAVCTLGKSSVVELHTTSRENNFSEKVGTRF